ncbi:MAG: acetolactate synthase small subunit [Rikenellaceae bacterium]|jgi:acetolactate synthase-1/3 small subunit|nr:acetolactate synthase small subunit [Rikenellaceae bacterium]
MNKEYIVIAFTENQIGVLNRITACYLRRKINIESLKVSESAIKGISMFVISAITTEELIDKTVRQIRNIIDVIEANWHDAADLVTQEIALFKISTRHLSQSGRVDALTRQWNMRIIEFNTKYVVLEKTGLPEEIDALRAELESEGLLETFTRSGSVVMLPDAPSTPV